MNELVSDTPPPPRQINVRCDGNFREGNFSVRNRFHDRRSLCARRQSVGGILHIAAGVDFA